MKRKRSTAHPVLDLATAYRILRQNLAGLGSAELHREEIAARLGYQTAKGGLAARKIGALVHYGLLQRRSADLYGLSPLGIRLQALSLGDGEFPSAIRKALEHPTLFKAILEHYGETGSIPRDLDSELARFGITAEASAEAARIFRESALFAGAIDTAGLFRGQSRPSVPASTKAPPTANRSQKEARWNEIQILLSGQRKGWLKLPQDLSLEDYHTLEESFRALYKILPRQFGFETPQRRRKPGSGISEAQKSSSTLPFRGRKNPRK